MIACHDIVDVADSSWSKSDLGEISRPHSSVGVLSLILRNVRSVDVVMDVSVSFVPFLIVILFVVVMSRVNGEVVGDPSRELKLLVDLIK